MSKKRRLLQVGLLLAVTMACAVPGVAVPGAGGQPALSSEDQLATIIVGTASILQTQTAQAIPPTETPAPVPSSSMTPTATFTPTVTSTPVFSHSGSALVEQEDGTTRFIDQLTGIELTFPAGWLTVRANEQEYYEFWTTEYDSNPVILTYMNLIGTSDNSFRLNAFDVRQEHIIDSFLTRVFVVFSDNQEMTLEEAIEGAETDLSSKYKLLSSEAAKTSTGIDIAVIESQFEALNSVNETVMAYRKRILLQTQSGIVMIDFVTLLEQKDLTLSEFDQIVDKIVLLGE